MGSGVRRKASQGGLGPLVLASLVGSACSSGFLAVPAQLDQLDQRVALEGAVEADGWTGSPLWVGLSRVLSDPLPETLSDRQKLVEPGAFRFEAPAGRYRLTALEDTNENGAWDEGERWAIVGYPEPLALEPGTAKGGIRLAIASKPTVGRPEPWPEKVVHRRTLGEVVTLDDERFRPESGPKGMWKPVEFLTEEGMGLYFLTEYREDRTPILFLHGMGGYPREFSTLVEALDPERFQPWVLHYPSGLSIEQLSLYLKRDLDVLQARLRFSRLCLVSHSMGGVVARATLGRYGVEGADSFSIPLAIALASPFGGVSSARMGVQLSPFVLPVWRDLAPTSVFLKTLFDAPLPPHTRTRLFAVHAGRPRREVVPLKSQLRSEAVAEAGNRVWTYVAEHAALLHDAAVVDRVMNELESCAPAR